MDITFQNIVLIVLVLLTGLSAGLCFTWANTVTTGIGRLDDFGYLNAFQQMNRTILNTTFFIVFFGPFFLNLISLYVFRNTSNSILLLLIMASAIYFIGIVLITIFGNVPLNELLDKTDLISASTDELRSLRERFEFKWNRYHLIRTYASIVSFLLIAISIIQITKQNIKL
ncbi:MAG: DUF1772 domain-containing protein [Psychroserpens sp.]|uniref:anthrone oxygenase family protein n=1 Tax=Psychroserpens sp. TaxID=2020870 RepID=UPI0030028C3B